MEQVRFKKYDCAVGYAQYGNGRLAIVLTDSTTHQVIAKATVNLPDIKLAKDEVAIKDFAENEGMLKALRDAGIVSAPLRIVASGHVMVPICQYTGSFTGHPK